jgi:hypothetical protein
MYRGIGSKISSNLGWFTKSKSKAKTAKLTVAAMAAMTALAMGSATQAAISNVTSLTTSLTTGASTTVSGQSGYGASYSIYKTSSTYNLDFTGEDEAVKTVTAGSLGTYQVSGLGTVTVRRSSTGGNNDTVWYAGTGNGTNKSTVMLDGSLVSGFNQALSSNNLLMGADNVFSNEGNAVGNNTNVDRIDVVFSAGLTAGTNAFSVMDRGASNDHDAFKIAAITGIGTNGQPTSYGPLISFGDGTWGNTNLLPVEEENILRKNNTLAGATLHPSDSTAQAIGGVLIQTDSLVSAGTKIYGYSLFSADAKGTGSQLVDWTNTTYFPPANATSSGGGLDPVATIAALYTPLTAVPEPAMCSLLMFAACGILGRRHRRDNTTK